MTKPTIFVIETTQWAEFMGKMDLLIQSVQSIKVTIQPEDVTEIKQAVKDISDLNFVIDRGLYREELFGRFQEG